MKRLAVTACLALSALLLSSCATIVAGGPTTLSTDSTPQGAQVTAVGLENGERLTGTTPTTFTLDKGSDYELTFSLDGFESETIIVRREVNAWFFGNILFGGIPGGIVDAVTNNMWKHTMSVASVDFTSMTQLEDGTFQGYVVVLTYDANGTAIPHRVPVIFNRV